MEREKFEAFDPLIDEIADILHEFLESDKGAMLKEKIAAFSQIIGRTDAVSLDCRLEVFDEKRDRLLPFLSTGICATADFPPYRMWNDSTLQRYVANGQMTVVPHDYCPVCWGKWDFKVDRPMCKECGARLGEEVRILLDSDKCPHCEEGDVGISQLTCPNCGFEINPQFVIWG